MLGSAQTGTKQVLAEHQPVARFLEAPRVLKPRESEHAAQQLVTRRSIVRQEHLLGAVRLDPNRALFGIHRGSELVPRYIFEKVPAALALRSLEEFHVGAVKFF